MSTLVAPNHDATMPKPPRPRRWIPVSLQMTLANIIVVGGWLAARSYRQQRVIRDLSRAGASYSTNPIGPEWAHRILFNWGYDLGRLPQNVVSVEVGYNVYPQDFDCGWFESLPELEVLKLEAAWLGPIELSYVAGLQNLRDLSLRGSQVSDRALRHIGGLSNLKSLDLSGTNISDDGLQHLKRLKNLESLGLWNTRVTDDGLAHLKSITSLQWLRLDDMRVTDAGVADLQRALPDLMIDR
jgi:hypothetical protein